jgi:hypothetical protein
MVMLMMGAAKSAVVNGVSQLKLSGWWVVIATMSFGMELGKGIWKPHDDFYPFPLLIWGAITVISVLGLRGNLVGLPYAVTLEEASAMRNRTRPLFRIGLGTACVSLALGLCVVASKTLRGIYPAVAGGLAILLFLLIFLMYRKIARLV